MWIYETTKYDSDGKIKQTTIDTLLIVSDTIDVNEHLYIVNENKVIGTAFLTNKENGLWLQGEAYRTEFFLFVKYPVVLGEIFSRFTTDTSIVEQMGEKVRIKTGQTYRCIRYKFNEADKLFKAYFSPDYGLIKVESFRCKSKDIEYLVSSMELIEPPILK